MVPIRSRHGWAPPAAGLEGSNSDASSKNTYEVFLRSTLRAVPEKDFVSIFCAGAQRASTRTPNAHHESPSSPWIEVIRAAYERESDLQRELEEAEIGVIFGEKGADDSAAEHVAVIDPGRDVRAPIPGERRLDDAKELVPSAGGTRGEAEPDVAIGERRARALIPEVLLFGDADRVEVGAPRDRRLRPEDQLDERVLVVLQVVERRPRVDPRGRQHLEERAVIAVGGIVVAGGAAVADAKPRLPRERGLPAGLEIVAVRPVIERPPIACLHQAPSQEIERPGAGRDHLLDVSAERVDRDVGAEIRLPLGQRAVVRLQEP